MKLALIADTLGFDIVDNMNLSYHLPLAQYVLKSDEYAAYYKEKSLRGDFLIMDNGAAEDGTVDLNDLIEAIRILRPDEVILPDVLKDRNATLEQSFNPTLLGVIPPKQRAVAPQGTDFESWMECAETFVGSMKDFSTICIPKHTESFEGGRMRILFQIGKMGWHRTYHIHLLGVYFNPYLEIQLARSIAPWVRGIDTAAPFAWAQASQPLNAEVNMHYSHAWGEWFDRALAIQNARTLHRWVSA